MQENAKANTKKYWWTGVIIFIVIIILVGYGAGFRLGGSYLIERVGTVSTTIPLKNTSIYIDNSDKIVTSNDNQAVEVKLSPGVHSFIVSHDGLLPWTKDVTVPNDGMVKLSPIFVSQNTSGEFIGESDPEYYKIKNSIKSDVMPTKTIPLMSRDGTTFIWLEDNAIMAKVNGETETVISPETKIKNLDFYKDRSDAVIFSTADSVYVIEINKEGTQNFLPLYKGKDPYFVKNDANSIYVLDGTSLMQVGI